MTQPRSQVPVFLLKSDGEKQGLVHTVCACAPITKNHGNQDISAVFYSVTLLLHPISSFNLHSKNCLQYIFTTSPGALSLRCNTVFHPLLTGKLADRTHDRTPLFHREWHVIQRMRRQCVPGPVFHRPDLKEKLGPGNEAKHDLIHTMLTQQADQQNHYQCSLAIISPLY